MITALYKSTFTIPYHTINEAGGPDSGWPWTPADATCLVLECRFGIAEVGGSRPLSGRHVWSACVCEGAWGARPETSREGSLILTPSGMRETQTTNQKRAAVSRWGQWAASPATSCRS